MRTFLPLFAGLALWCGLAVMVGVTFERPPAPVTKPPASRVVAPVVAGV